MNNPKVSILIPLYNSEKYIAETIESSLNQSYKNIEIIIVDDGSTDNSLQIAKQYEKYGIKVFSQSNKGSCYTRNRALQLSNGEFIQYLDADDLLSSDKISSQMAKLKKYKNKIASCKWAVFYEKSEDAIFENLEIFKNTNPVDWLILSWGKGLMMQPACWLTHRSIIEKTGKWDYKSVPNDDGEFFARVLLNSDEILYDDIPKVFYRRGVENSLSSKNDIKATEGRLYSYISYEKNILQKENSSRVKYACYLLYLRFIYENYEIDKKIVEIAKGKIFNLGFKKLKPYGTKRFKTLAHIIGFENTLKLRKLFKGK